MNGCFIGTSHSTVGVRHYQYSVYAQQVRGEHERSQYVIGNARASVAENLRIASLHTNNSKWANSGIHASNDGKPSFCCTSKFRMLKTSNKLFIRAQNIREFTVWK
jgi:hypothetical protein